MAWNDYSGNLGYRIFRSTAAGQRGIAITDFAIGGTSFVDVNVDPNTTYYYTLYAVTKEATESGGPEQLSALLGSASVKTGASILGGGFTENGGQMKNLILMKIDDPYMSVNGQRKEIDPGRGTTPQILNSRTIVPIAAIIQAMGGTVGWDGATRQVTLAALGHNVTMWVDKKDIIVDGVSGAMDVAPAIINSRTMVPVKFVAENVGATIEWIASTREIVIVYYSGGNGQTAAAAPAPQQGPSSALTTGLTLAALSQAATDANFTVRDQMGIDSNGQSPDPKAGFMIGVMHDGMLLQAVYVNEFASESDAQAYKTAMDNSQMMDNHTYLYKQFCVEFHSSAYDVEGSVMAAFTKVGWNG